MRSKCDLIDSLIYLIVIKLIWNTQKPLSQKYLLKTLKKNLKIT